MTDQLGGCACREVADLNQQYEATDDPRECYRLVQEQIQHHHKEGSKVPEDLAILERQLMRECAAESQGR